MTPPPISELRKTYSYLIIKGKINQSGTLDKILQKRAVRTLSGVAIITVLTKSWPCPGRCIYCPLEPDMPKSYLKCENTIENLVIDCKEHIW